MKQVGSSTKVGASLRLELRAGNSLLFNKVGACSSSKLEPRVGEILLIIEVGASIRL